MQNLLHENFVEILLTVATILKFIFFTNFLNSDPKNRIISYYEEFIHPKRFK